MWINSLLMGWWAWEHNGNFCISKIKWLTWKQLKKKSLIFEQLWMTLTHQWNSYIMFRWNTVNVYTVMGPMRSVRSEQSIVVGNLFLPSITKWGLQCKRKWHNTPAEARLASETYKITLDFHTSTQYSSFFQHKLCVLVRNWLSRSHALVNRNLTPALPADLTGRQSEQINTFSLTHHAEIGVITAGTLTEMSLWTFS